MATMTLTPLLTERFGPEVLVVELTGETSTGITSGRRWVSAWVTRFTPVHRSTAITTFESLEAAEVARLLWPEEASA